MPAVKPAKLPDSPAKEESANRNERTTSSRNGQPPSGPGPLRRLWRTIKSIYYASAPSWQILKSGALFFFGFFCWSSANLLWSYQPGWAWTYFLMAYGFLLTWYGPLTHLVLVPHVIPWLRRRKRGSLLHGIGKKVTQINLTIFFTAVLLMGLFPPKMMTFDFRAMTGGTSTVDVNPALECTRNAATIECRLEHTEGVGAITVKTGGTTLTQRHTPPFAFSVQENDLVEIVGQRQFQVVVHTPDGAPVRRFTRTASTIR